MKKLLLSLTIIAMTTAILIGCKGKNAAISGDPKTVITAFFEHLSKKDFDGAAKLATAESKGTLDMVKKGMDMGEKMKDQMGDVKVKEKDPSEDFKNLKYGETKIDGDNATVSITNPSKDNQTISFGLKKEGGNWKVDFSMAALMKMGMNGANNKMDDAEGDNTDSKDEVPTMDELNKLMNSDSLKMGLEKMDSLMKTIDPEKMKEVKDAMEKLKNLNN